MWELVLLAGAVLALVGTVALMRSAWQEGRPLLAFLLPGAAMGQLQQHWTRLWPWALVRVAGLWLLLVALLGAVGDRLLPGSATRAVPSLSQLEGQLQQPLSGVLQGQRFVPDRVTLINGVLSVQQGGGLLPPLELRGYLGDRLGPLDSWQRMTVLATETGAPELHLAWHESSQAPRQTRIFDQRYALRLELAPFGADRLMGRMLLVTDGGTQLAGSFTAYTREVSYQDDRFDPQFDHEEVLRHLLRERVAQELPVGSLAALEIDHVQLWRRQGRGEAAAKVTLHSGREEYWRVPFQRGDGGWQVHSPGIVIEVLRDVARVAPRRAEDQAVTLAQLAQWQGERMTVIGGAHHGRRGRLTGVVEDGVQIEVPVGSGYITYFVTVQGLQGLRRESGQRLLLPKSVTGAADTLPPVVDVMADAALPQPVPHREHLRKLVRVGLRDGSSRVGILAEADPRRLRLDVSVGAGQVSYHYRQAEVETLAPVTVP